MLYRGAKYTVQGSSTSRDLSLFINLFFLYGGVIGIWMFNLYKNSSEEVILFSFVIRLSYGGILFTDYHFLNDRITAMLSFGQVLFWCMLWRRDSRQFNRLILLAFAMLISSLDYGSRVLIFNYLPDFVFKGCFK